MSESKKYHILKQQNSLSKRGHFEDSKSRASQLSDRKHSRTISSLGLNL